uniref:BRCT domain-containing protein n=3 Tax=Brassica TaxID=3705 RepID=A0A0D3ABT1_BRAOL
MESVELHIIPVGVVLGNEECPPNMCVEKKNEGNRTARKLFPEDDSPEENCTCSTVFSTGMINNREDEGGGDICRRRREDIFGVASKARRSFTRKVHSDSRLLHRSVTRGRKVIQAATKNLGKELDAEHNKKMSDMVALGQSKGTYKRIHAMGKDELLERRMKKASPSPAKPCGKSIQRSSERRKIHTASRETKKSLLDEFDRPEEEEEEAAGFDTQMAAEAINDLHSGNAREIDNESNNLIEKRGGELSNQRCRSNLLKQSSGGDEAEVLSCPKRRRRSARSISQDQDNEAPAFDTPVKSNGWWNLFPRLRVQEREDIIDEDLYILRDSKKEKEFGFNMGVSLTRARQNPLLKGRRVFITPTTKPGLNTITTLVKAVHGQVPLLSLFHTFIKDESQNCTENKLQPVERLGKSFLSEDKVPENLLVLSCEEDQDISIPFLERGAEEVYSSKLLLNGIVTYWRGYTILEIMIESL